MTAIIVAIITSIFTFLGVVVTTIWGNKQTKKQTDLTLYRIDQLEKKQDKHNTLIERMYRLEENQKILDEKIKVANHRIEDLEHRG